MGFFKWLQKKGSVGSTVRTIIRQYKFVKSRNSDLREEEILKYIFENRYKSVPPLGSSAKLRYSFALSNPKTFASVRNLTMSILDIEMDINQLGGKVFINSSQIVDEEISRLI